MKEMKTRIYLPALFQDHMVLQRDSEVRVFGTADEAVQKVCVEIEGVRTCASIDHGAFLVCFPAQPAGTHKTVSLFVNDENKPEVVLEDVSFGDIWLACGQSNMEYFMRYDSHWDVTKSREINPDIHMFNVPRIAYEGQKWDHHEDSGFWFKQGDYAWETFSAPGFYFADQVQPSIGVPMGVIGCNWGGTPACAWVDEHYIAEAPLDVYMREYNEAVSQWDVDDLEKTSLRALEYENSYGHQMEVRALLYGLSPEDQEDWKEEHKTTPVLPMGPWHHYRPCGLYHTMIETIAPFAIKGVLWYQGESDEGKAELYAQMMETLIRCYRETFMNPELPFIFVQLAPFDRWLDCIAARYFDVREQQDLAAHTIKNAYMASIMDIGDRFDIHPKKKEEVGRRLGLLARGHVYREEILCDSPELTDIRTDMSSVAMTFASADGGFVIGEQADRCFCVINNSRKKEIRNLSADRNQLIIEVDDMEPGTIEVRFAFENYCEVRIWNQAGLPVKPFRKTVSLIND